MTASRRAGDVRASMMRGMPTRPAVEPSDRPDGEPSSRLSKYTVKLEPATAEEFDGLALRARRRLNRRVDKSEIVKALIRLASDDASLADQVIAELERR